MCALWRFTPWAGTWADISGASPTGAPSARAYHRLVSSGPFVYLFGGSSDKGVSATDCGVVPYGFQVTRGDKVFREA